MSLAARHETQFCRVIDDHIHGHGGEIHQHNLSDRTHPRNRSADGRADDGLFRDRC